MRIDRRRFLAASVATAALTVSACAPRRREVDLNAVLDRIATDILRESPEFATSLAVPEQRAGGRYKDRLSDVSREGLRRLRGVRETGIAALEQIDRNSLSAQDAVSRDVVLTALRNDIDSARFEYGGGATAPYVVNQISGAYTAIPDFLDSQHPVASRDDADAYLARLSGYARMLDQETAMIAEDAGKGVIAPSFCIDGAIRQLTAFANLAPANTVLVQSLTRRLAERAEIAPADKTTLGERAEAIARNEVLPAYRRQIEALTRIRPRATADAGVWRLSDGAALYAAALKSQTTTNMTPDEIHEMGVELGRDFNGQMESILRAQGLTQGSLAQRMQAISRRPDQLYPNTDAGRERLLADLNRQIEEITARMPSVSGVLARARLQIKRVPPYIEAGAPGGYYQSAALDGSRPGAYYINLRDTREWPKFTLPTLTYHEGVPGHHWQISIQQEAQGLPFIRSALLGFNAYAEGWALYAETLADELGFYANNPLGRLGFLQSMAFRASRLVVDTGLHHKRWTREQAIESMMAATGDLRSSVTTEVERYCAWPGQACGYMVGRQVILRLRDEAKRALGDRFDLKGFHDAVLVNGSTPLSVTEQLVRAWIDQRRAGGAKGASQ
jgi:uncharacterized protein (DUF885 family)